MLTHLLALAVGLTFGYILAVADRRALLWEGLDGFCTRIDQVLANMFLPNKRPPNGDSSS